MTKINIFLIPGLHAKRTPMAYSEYKPYFNVYFNFVDSPSLADFIVASYFVDLRAQAAQLVQWQKANPKLKLVVLSEEPLWDTLFYKNTSSKAASFAAMVEGKLVHLNYYFLNHTTSNIFDFESLPYFITTESHYVQRYAHLLKQCLTTSIADVKNQMESANYKAIFIAEKRVDEKYHKVTSANTLLGISVYRTKIAENFWAKQSYLVQGRGWFADQKRQALDDWHLDKLNLVCNNALLVSAIENTLLPNYVTEKPFDAFAANAIPIVYAGAYHRFYELIGQQHMGVLDICGKTVEQAVDAINSFVLTAERLEHFRLAQQSLHSKFKSLLTLVSERERVAFAAFQEFSDLMDA